MAGLRLAHVYELDKTQSHKVRRSSTLLTLVSTLTSSASVGLANIVDVNELPPDLEDIQESFVLTGAVLWQAFHP